MGIEQTHDGAEPNTDSLIDNAREYWNDRDEYKGVGESIYPGYHDIRLGKVKALIDSIPDDKLTCVDAGCGEGDLILHALEKGWDAEGFDLSDTMVDDAANNLIVHGESPQDVYQGGMEVLENYPDDSVDVLLAINVLTYLDDERDAYFYEQANRIVPEGGTMIVAHSNELFDMFTFNRYTTEFFEDTILPLAMDDTDAIQTAADELRDLITHPNDPEPGTQFASERDNLEKRQENPLVYSDKLQSYGFDQDELLYTHYHAVPPLLIADNDEYAELGKQLEESDAAAAYGPLLASIFISKATKL